MNGTVELMSESYRLSDGAEVHFKHWEKRVSYLIVGPDNCERAKQHLENFMAASGDESHAALKAKIVRAKLLGYFEDIR